MVTTANVRIIWEIARDTVGTERAYDKAPCGEGKAKASKAIRDCYGSVKAMGEEEMRLYMTYLEILRSRESL